MRKNLKKYIGTGFLLLVLKILTISFGWYLMYEFWLSPEDLLSKWLTINIAEVSAGILKLLDYDSYIAGSLIGISESAGVLLNEVFINTFIAGLFIGVVIVLPIKWSIRLAFIVIGTGLIYLLKMVRITVVVISRAEFEETLILAYDYSPVILLGFSFCIFWIIRDRLRKQLSAQNKQTVSFDLS